MEIALQDGGLRVRAQYPNWPAAKAGVIAGDIITYVDDTPIRGLNLAEVQGKLRGPVGTSVRLKIVHAGQDNPVNVTVVRELVAGIGMEIAIRMMSSRFALHPRTAQPPRLVWQRATSSRASMTYPSMA
jgi:hypothetical protein